MKFWISDMLTETLHLTLAQFGAHVRLMCLAWRRHRCSLPADPGWIMRRLNIDEESYHRDVVPVLEEFWSQEEDEFVNTALRKEFADAIGRSQKARNAAHARHHGENERALKIRENF